MWSRARTWSRSSRHTTKPAPRPASIAPTRSRTAATSPPTTTKSSPSVTNWLSGCEPFPYYRYADEDPADFLNQGTADRHAVKLPKVYPLTDMGNAERFEQHFASEFIWTKETGWLAYRDGVWEEDKTAEADQAMQITVRLITQEAELVEGDDEAAENMRDAIIGWAKQSEANAKIKAALERAS